MRIAAFDFFPKAKEDIETSSAWGGLYSIIGFICGLLLIITEVNEHIKKEWKKEMSVDNILATDLQVNIDIIFKNTPCHIIALELEDDSGNHKPGGPVTINKVRLGQNGDAILNKSIPNPDDNKDEFYNNLLEAIKAKEGCRIFGNFSISAAPGNFHFSFHHQQVVYFMLPQDLKNEINLNFDINYLSFGNVEEHKIIQKMFLPKKIDFSLEKKISVAHQGKQRTDYFLKIVSNRFSNTGDNYLQGFQYSLNSKETEVFGEAPPGVFFTYEVTPITIVYTLEHRLFSHFLVQMCAIVGGIFAVLGILSSLTIESVNFFRKLA